MNGQDMDEKLEETVPVENIPATEEIQKLLKHFNDKFGDDPDFVVRVPGRVNLIGEHIDYSGYAVCPMAIRQHILVAVKSTNDNKLHLTNVNTRYPDFETHLNDLKIEVAGVPAWHQYFMCGIAGIFDELSNDGKSQKGFKAAVLGTIPPRAGLSSSSALVCAAAIAAGRVFSVEKTKLELAEMAAKCERYIGTQGGGMDQAIAILATPGSAKLISFNPLSATDVCLPDGAVFVVANSLQEMNKAATADYNCRVVESRLVSFVLAKRMNMVWQRHTTLSHLSKAVGLGVRHLAALACETLDQKPFTKRAICCELQINEEELDKTCLTENTKHLNSFKLKQRMTHITQEIIRVQNFVRLCKEVKSGTESREAALWKIGSLMKQSHESLRNNYECSHEDLDAIVKIAEKHTLGARLTGAGWGGCTVALTTADKAQNYIKALKEEFYAKKEVTGDFDDIVFVTEPGGGAVVYLNSGVANNRH